MNQINLSFPPASRNTDPLSSFEAEEQVERSGKRKTQAIRVFEAVKEYPEQTAGELEFLTGIPHNVLCRRLPDLRVNSYVRVACMRTCRVKNCLSQVWEVEKDLV